MSLLKLGTNFIYQELPNEDFVCYSSEGSSLPFVLTGKAKLLFEELLQQGGVESDTLVHLLAEKGFHEDEVRAILGSFEAEGILFVENPRKALVPKRKPSTHLTFWMHVTNMCTLRCSYCYIYKEPGRMSVETVDEFLSFLVGECASGRLESITLKFAGGEPTMEISLIRYIVEESKKALEPYGITLRFTMITNGTLLTEATCKFLTEERFSVSVSLDGLGSFNDERLYPNGRQSVTDILVGIERLQEYGTKPDILAVVSNTNVKGLRALIDYTIENDLRINLILNRALKENGDLLLDLRLMKRELMPMLREVVRLEEAKLPTLSFSTVSLNGKRSRACSGGGSYFVLGHDGKISTCPMAVTRLQDGGKKLGQDFIEVRGAFSPKARELSCQQCIWKFACAGGCDVIAKGYTYTSTSIPYCSIMKPILQALLFLEGRKIQIAKRR